MAKLTTGLKSGCIKIKPLLVMIKAYPFTPICKQKNHSAGKLTSYILLDLPRAEVREMTDCELHRVNANTPTRERNNRSHQFTYSRAETNHFSP